MLRLVLALTAAIAVLTACEAPSPAVSDHPPEGNFGERLAPMEPGSYESLAHGRQYVPVYSSIYWGSSHALADLTATVSVRNVAADHPIILESVSYFDSSGKLVRDYLDRPAELAAMATVDFVIPTRDQSGGSGANFLVEWASEEQVIEAPLIEAVMVGKYGSVGISFTSPGRPVRRVRADPSNPAGNQSDLSGEPGR